MLAVAAAMMAAGSVVQAAGADKSIMVTAVEVQNAGKLRSASVTLNDIIKIDEITISKKNGRESIKFPQYINKNGQSYPQIVILDEAVKKNIEKAVLSGAVSPPAKAKLEYKVTRLSLLSGQTRRGNAEIAFNETVRVTGGVMENKGGELWIAWPARQNGKSGWVKQLTFLRPAFKKMLEEEIINKYKAARSEEAER